MSNTLKLTDPDTPNVSQDLSFEAGLKELEDIVTKMEAGQVSLDDAVSLYERGMALQKRCQKQLEDARLRIEKIAVNSEGGLTLEPFEDVETPTS
jgi:exodeoxyribonuclease VII small subunit